jgi:hypothetical protein
MSHDQDEWERANNDFLGAALKWLRLRVRNATPLPLPTSAVAPSPLAQPTDAEIEAAARAMDSALMGDPSPALILLQRRLGLSRFERDVLLLAVAPEYDTSFSELYGAAQGNPARSQATFALAMAVFDEPRWEALAPHRPLRHFELLAVGGVQGLVAAPLRVTERVVNFIKGLNHLDSQLTALLAPLDIDQLAEPAPSQLPAVEEIVRLAAQRSGALANLVGPDRPSKQLVAAAAASRLGLRLLRLPAANLPTGVGELAALSRLLEREQLLSPVALYLDATDPGPDHASEPGAIEQLLAGSAGLVTLDSRDPWPRLPQWGVLVDVERPATAEQRDAWAELTGDRELAAATAAEFDLDLAMIHAVAAGTADARGAHRAALVRQACRARCRPRLGLLAQRLSPRTDVDAVVLAAEVTEQLRLLEQQVRFRSTVVDDWGMAEQSARGLGLTALFAGEPGVGKTLAAEVLAGRLDLDLYRIDLSGVVSKYIGETEKNLRAVFDAADRGGSILFFDEADALFGKRSEVRDSHDRYANIEISYLLARMEMHRGLAILATNMKRGLDEAFARRLRICVDFPFPGEDERAAIWAKAFPPGAQLTGVDYRRLARLSLAGGAIRNVAVNAAFMAAAAPSQSVTMAMVFAAARREYRKLGIPSSALDFHWDEPRLIPAAGGGGQ